MGGVISAISSRKIVPWFGQLEAAGPAFHGAGERALLVTEQLAFEQRFGNRGAVDRDVGRVAARAQPVDRLRDQLLARAGLAADQHGRVGRRRLLDDVVDLPHLGAVADHRAEGALLAQLAAQHLDLAQRLVPLDDLRQQDPQPLEIDRLGQVVVGAFLDRLHGGLDRALGGQDHGGRVLALLLERPQQLEAAHLRHHQVGEDDARPEDADLRQRLVAVAGRFDAEAPAPDQLLHAHAGGGVVFDDQDALVELVANLFA